MAVLWIGELGVPFKHIKGVLRHMGLGRTKISYLLEDCYFAQYFIGRIVIGCIPIWNILICNQIPLLLRVGGFTLQIRTFFFLHKMAKIVQSRKAFFKELEENEIELNWFNALDNDKLARCE